MARKSSLNLDSLFGNTIYNVVGEPITPKKIAIVYLIRSLFRIHFGYKNVPSGTPVSAVIRNKILSVCYSLIFYKNEISYENFRKVIRESIDEQPVYYLFIVDMENIARGITSIDLRMEDSMFTGKREPSDHGFDYSLPKGPPLLNSKSFLHTWLKRMRAQYEKSTQMELFELNQVMRRWLAPNAKIDMDPDIELKPVESLPFEIDCSLRSRKWISKQLHIIQFTPSKCESYLSLLKICNIIKKRHPDVFSAHLLESVVNVQLQRAPDAVKSMKNYFDLCMFRLNESVTHASQTYRLTVASQKPLRYAPLLEGRIHRIFGNINRARVLFTESVQQSQMTLDDICNRIANIEMSMIELIGNKPLLEEFSEENKKEKKSLPQTLVNKEIDEHFNPEEFVDDPEESYEIYEQLLAISKMIFALEDIQGARYCIKSSELMEKGLRIPACSDYQLKTRAVDDFGMAISTSNLIRNGMFHQSKRVAENILTLNFDRKDVPPHETESQAVAGVNLAYSCASLGEHAKAFKVLDKLEIVFAPEINWMGYRHIRIARLLISFERCYLDEKLVDCDNILKQLMPISTTEYNIRKGLLLATKGQTDEAISLLMKHSAKCVDTTAHLRIILQLASVYITVGFYCDAEELLKNAASISVNTTLRNMRFMITRRCANIMIMRKEYEKALKLLFMIKNDVLSYATITERIVYNYSIVRCLRMLKKDSSIYIAYVRQDSIKCGWKTMEKMVLAEAMIYYEQIGNFEMLEKVGAIFDEIDQTLPEPNFKWTLL